MSLNPSSGLPVPGAPMSNTHASASGWRYPTVDVAYEHRSMNGKSVNNRQLKLQLESNHTMDACVCVVDALNHIRYWVD
ncbi:hypothetical protein T265_09920 [Opisthorchis viverrini]|uniref:Uncharacterized protein n=1 Tax=Opisthorchis viverrini TaxID=6198 RepID=A0A074ZF46_OPIVI|nr:hypothetical protein T265_09920 [Opisthorchis viverrini]KER21855.1 hypothetical protein T265_09920 [Opisthorchis viverrini]